MTVLWIIIICFVVAIVAGTIIAMARKQQTLDIEESTMPPDLPPDAGGPLGAGTEAAKLRTTVVTPIPNEEAPAVGRGFIRALNTPFAL